MGITYDKKSLKKTGKYLKMGKKRYALRQSFFMAIFQAVFLTLFLCLIDNPCSLNKSIIMFSGVFVFNLASGYFIGLKQWNNMKNIYDESMEYFKEKNPDFIKDIMEENSSNDK